MAQKKNTNPTAYTKPKVNTSSSILNAYNANKNSIKAGTSAAQNYNYSTENPANNPYMNRGVDGQKIQTTSYANAIDSSHRTAEKQNVDRAALTGTKPVTKPNKPENKGDGGNGNGSGGSGNKRVMKEITQVPSPSANTGTGSNSWIRQQLLNLYNNQGVGQGQTPYSNQYYEQLMAESAPRTEEEYRQQAEASLMPAYNNAVLAANQALERQNLAYDQQLQALQDVYNKNRNEALASNEQTVQNMNRNNIRRGMARSTYAGDAEAQTRIQLAQQLQEMAQQYGTDAGNIAANRALAQSQNAQELQNLMTNLGYQTTEQMNQYRESERANRMNVLGSMASSLDSYNNAQQSMKMNAQQNQQSSMMNILSMISSMNQQEEAQRLESQRSGGGGSGSRGGSQTPSGTPAETPAGTTPDFNAFSDYLALLGGAGTQPGFGGSNIYQAAHQYADAQNEARVSGRK